jgi:hypothetical protein
MKKITLLLSSLSFFAFGVFAQNNVDLIDATYNGETFQTPVTRTCGTMDNITAQDIANFEDAIAPHVAAYIQSQINNGNPEVSYNIPTIVHIIHNSNENVGSGRNISATRVVEQLQVLNDDFRRTNADKTNTPSYFTGVAADCEVNFCLVTRYPSGHPSAGQILPEKGINRVSAASISGVSNTSSGYSMSTIDNTIKPATFWNPAEVMNIWVCQLQSGLLGYATFPGTGFNSTQGTVIGYQYFGLTGGSYGLGRTTTHEIGHFLGLYHIWGDDNGACSGSDQCSDTPNQANATGGCPSGKKTDACTSGNGIMYQNYMDYSNDACMNIFTEKQKARIQSTLATSTYRKTLNSFSATLCAPTSVDDIQGVDGISIYPNPTKNMININFTIIKNSEISIFNMLGEVVYLTNSFSKNSISVDMSNQPNGVYFVRVKTNDKLTTQKVILNR